MQATEACLMSRLRILIANTHDPYFNLATEDWIFRDMSLDSKVLYIWRNANTIVIGRGQNAWSECDLAATERDGVTIARRHSGGGAVFQDLGNTCFTFMSPREASLTPKELYAKNNDILLGALRRLGIEAQASGRNDLVVESQGELFKISGSAFKESPDRVFHHGTMLLHVDLTRLGQYLTPDQKKLEAKGIKSVASRVKNLSDLVAELDHSAFCNALITEFETYYNAKAEFEELDHGALQAIPSLSNYYETLRSWDWVFGKSPTFEHRMIERFSWGLIELHLNTQKGHIEEAKLFSDTLDTDFLDEASHYLVGRPYTAAGIKLAERAHREEKPEKALPVKDFYEWVEAQLL